MKRRIFDPDLSLQYLEAQELAFPLQARIQTEFASVKLLAELNAPGPNGEPSVLARNPDGYVIFTEYDDQAKPVLARIAETNIWVPWVLLQPDLTLHLN